MLCAPALDQDPRAFYLISRDWRSLLRLHFLFAAMDAGLLRAMDSPRTVGELVRDLGAKREEMVCGLLELGTSLGELAQEDGRYRIVGHRSRSLRDEKNDALAAMIEANVTYYNSVFRHLADRVRGGPLDDGLGEIGPLVARVSRIAEPYVEHLIREHVRGADPLRILDVGCGACHHLRTALDANPKATAVGLDADPDVVTQARANVRAWGLDGRASVLAGDIRVPVDGLDGPFDRVFLLSVAYYFDPPARVAMLRLLRERVADGRLILVTSCRGPNMDPFSANLNLATTSMRGLTSLPLAREMDNQLREAGFTTIRRRRLIPGTTYYAFLAE